jgi:hypothetical protein
MLHTDKSPITDAMFFYRYILYDFSCASFNNIHHKWILLMTIAGLGEHEKLENIYFCPKCRGVFLFKSDVEDHSRTHAGHEKLEVIPLK